MSAILKLSSARLAVFAAASLALLLAASPAASQSHLNQPVKEHVVLQFFSVGKGGACPDAGVEGSTLAMYRVFPDGHTQLFSVPKGKVLVVTDFNVRAYIPSGAGSARSAVETTFKLTDKNLSGTIVYRSSFHLTNDLDARGFVINGDMRGGVAVGAARALCPSVAIDDGSQNNLKLTVTAGNLRGYLIDA